jgi:hypothetical protein
MISIVGVRSSEAFELQWEREITFNEKGKAA